jgi:nitroimidazol reductase NimA-like FMN-containing flavoprotein (pyridoxamine 5'-phosphate oxidase superfamily)
MGSFLSTRSHGETGMSAPQPQAFRPLDRAGADAILARNRVGRIAYTRRGRLEVEPVLYAWATGGCGRAPRTGSAGRPSRASRTAPPSSFEVDEVDAGFRWRSVVVRGLLHPVEHPADGGDPAVWVHAVELVRALDPAITGAALRSSLVRIAVEEADAREGAGEG